MTQKNDSAAELKIPPAFQRAVKERLESGQFKSADEVFAVCLELLEREEREYDQKLAWLQNALDEGDADIARGDVIDGEQAFAEALASYRQRHGRSADSAVPSVDE
jgi:Arc/MetJ-type ribon-helix-helix transcriptional regulator